LNEADPLYQEKVKLIGTAPSRRTYRLMTDWEDFTTNKMMSWMRYIEYTGDFSLLVDHKGRNQQNQDSESEEDENFYRAENIDMVDLENETRCLTNLK